MSGVNEEHVAACLAWLRLTDRERQRAYNVLFSRGQIRLTDALKIAVIEREGQETN